MVLAVVVAFPVVRRSVVEASAKKAKDFLPFLHRSRKVPAVVEYVLSGHRFKLLIPKETCSIAFALSGVRCPGRDEPYSDEAIVLMRRKIMQRDVEIEVETCDRTGTFIGSLWESKTNIAITLLEAGLAKLQASFGSDRIPDFHLLEQAELSAKRQRLKIWENYVEGEEVSNGAAVENKQQEVLKVMVTEVLGGGKFYVQLVGDHSIESIQQKLGLLNLQNEAPLLGAFNPKKGDVVLSLFLVMIKLGTAQCGKVFKAKVEERDTSGGKVKGQGTGAVLAVTLVAKDSETSVNAAMLQVRFPVEFSFCVESILMPYQRPLLLRS